MVVGSNGLVLMIELGKHCIFFLLVLPLSPLKVAKTHSSRTSFFYGAKKMPALLFGHFRTEKTCQVAKLPGDMAKLVSMSFLDSEVNPAPKIIISSQTSQGSKQFCSLKYITNLH